MSKQLLQPYLAVSALGANDVWAVGDYYNNVSQTLTEHWDGTAWSIVPSPNAGSSTNYLISVSTISANDVWAVGIYEGTGFAYKTLVEHWDGTAWSIVLSPNVGAGGNDLLGVAANAADDVWAVGEYGYPSPQTLILHWDGIAWAVVPSPNPSSYNILNGVTAISADHVWTVGVIEPNNVEKSLVEHWDGTAWSVVSSPNVGEYHNQLTSVVASSANDVWAVGGYYEPPSRTLTLVEHFTSPCVTPTATPTDTATPTLIPVSTNTATYTSTTTTF